jgi:nucleoside-diphosphate-sugar epimerase
VKFKCARVLVTGGAGFVGGRIVVRCSSVQRVSRRL